jgi:2-keto-4-pentenoate hydratase/2-oxohepta-3-ene-1,7-dioic acid hydratase in catechol pathway
LSRFVRIKEGDRIYWGRIDGEQVMLLERAPWDDPIHTGRIIKLDPTKLLTPVTPSKIVLIGKNYPEHIREMQAQGKPSEEPIIFMKPPTSVIGPRDPIPRYGWLDRVDYEGELAAVIGKKLFRSDFETVKRSVFGYTILNDVTARTLQKKDGQWTRAKGFDGFCPVGPWIATDIDPLDLAIETRLNGESKQSGRTSQQVWNIYELIGFISNVMTLLPGDLISTGTPQGVGPLAPGDTVKITIENIGILENKVVAA